MAVKREEEASDVKERNYDLITLSILTFGFLQCSGNFFGGQLLMTVDGVRVIHLLDRSLLYAVPGFDWDMKTLLHT